MHYLLVIQLICLLAVANTAPLIAKLAFRDRFVHPLDCNVTFLDGRPLFGKSKTIRGIVASLALTGMSAPIVGLSWMIGLLVSITAMAGDLLSSFIKRRLDLPPSSKATGLDQIPELLIPLLVCCTVIDLSVADIVTAVGSFFVGEVFFARLFYALKLRDQPY